MCYDCQMYAPVKCLAFHGANGIFCNIWLDAIHEKLAQLIYMSFFILDFFIIYEIQSVLQSIDI